MIDVATLLAEMQQLTRVSLTDGIETLDGCNIVDMESAEAIPAKEQAKLTEYAASKGATIHFYSPTQSHNKLSGYAVEGFFLDFNTYTVPALCQLPLSRLGNIAYFYDLPIVKDKTEMIKALIENKGGKLPDQHLREPKKAATKPASDIVKDMGMSKHVSKKVRPEHKHTGSVIQVPASMVNVDDKGLATWKGNDSVSSVLLKEAARQGAEQIDKEMMATIAINNLAETLRTKPLVWKKTQQKVVDITITQVNNRDCLAFHLADGEIVKYYPNAYKRYFEGV